MSGTGPISQPVSPKLLDAFTNAKAKHLGPYGKWVRKIQEIRIRTGCSVLEAERLALKNPHRRKWVERAINTGNPCRKYALAHIRVNEASSLIERKGATFSFRIPPP